MGPDPLSVPDILSLAFATMEEPFDLVKIIKSLDMSWMKWYSEKNSG